MTRKASEERITSETKIKVSWNLDGEGKYTINTGIPFMNHMLELFSKHGYFDLEVNAQGDIEIDDHHTLEDLGIVLGTVFNKAIGDKKGITRYGYHILPMDEALIIVSLDISNRPHLNFDVNFAGPAQNFDTALVNEFLVAFVAKAGITLHIKMLEGKNTHHIIEAIFKGLGKALLQAISNNPKEKGIPSTKGMI